MSSVEHKLSEDAMRFFQACLSSAESSGRWMAAAWKVENGMIHLVCRTTWEFPKDDLQEAIRLLDMDVRAETTLPTNPLPVAPEFDEHDVE